MAWIELFIAGIFEVVWSTCMKYSNGFTNLKFTIFTFAGMAVSFYFLAMAVKKLPMGTAYGVWTGVGALGAVVSCRPAHAPDIVAGPSPVRRGRVAS